MSRNWLPPESPRGNPWWVLASVAANVALVLLVGVTTQRSFPSPPVMVVLVPEGTPDGAVDMPWEQLGGPGRSPAVTGEENEAVTGGHGRSQAVTHGPPDRGVGEDVVVAGPPRPPGGEPRGEGPPGGVGEEAAGPPERAGGTRLGARFGDGRLWVRPWDAIAAAIARSGHDSLDAAGNSALLDSVIQARVTAFLAALPPDSFAAPVQPAWVTEIDGKKWGIDGSWIYLGGLKLPTAILALVPLPESGNYDGAKRAAELQRVREDIIQAARRAESLEQFKKNVKDTRDRKNAEREARKNQSVKPDSIRT